MFGWPFPHPAAALQIKKGLRRSFLKEFEDDANKLNVYVR
jgi:hypothetical protein